MFSLRSKRDDVLPGWFRERSKVSRCLSVIDLSRLTSGYTGETSAVLNTCSLASQLAHFMVFIDILAESQALIHPVTSPEHAWGLKKVQYSLKCLAFL